MSGFDRIQYFTREQLLSSDMNEDARLRARNLIEVVRNALASVQANADNDAALSEYTNSLVLGGLRVVPGVGGVIVTPGILAQYWAGGGTQPSLDESQYVIGEQRADVSVAIAVPGVDTWYLIQARASTLVTNATRSEWNPGTEVFDAIVVGQKLENVVELDAKIGTTTDIPLPDAGWIPLGGVKRLASGVDSTTKEMVDVRPLYDRQDVSVQTRGVAHANVSMATSHYEATVPTAGNTISFNGEVTSDLGHMFARINGDGFIDITSAPFKDPSTTFAANTWYYVYLANWSTGGFHGSMPRQAYNNVVHQGILLISHVPPDVQGSNDMPAGVTYPAPFAADPSRIGSCLFSLKRNSANTGWVAQRIALNTQHIYDQELIVNASGAAIAFGNDKFPVNARGAVVRVGSTSATVTIKTPTQTIIPVDVPGAALYPADIPLVKLDPALMTVSPTNPLDSVTAQLESLEF